MLRVRNGTQTNKHDFFFKKRGFVKSPSVSNQTLFFSRQVQYCGETCRDLSWAEYHRIECGILAYLEPSRYLGKMPHLALR